MIYDFLNGAVKGKRFKADSEASKSVDESGHIKETRWLVHVLKIVAGDKVYLPSLLTYM